MTDPNFILLYVDSLTASARFYAQLLKTEPVEASPTFVLFALKSGMMLGLWSKHTVAPAPAGGCGGELAFSVADDETVDVEYAPSGRIVDTPY